MGSSRDLLDNTVPIVNNTGQYTSKFVKRVDLMLSILTIIIILKDYPA